MHAIELRVGGERLSLVLRRMTREPWRTHARELLEREAAVLTMLTPSAIPSARVVGLDASAAMLLMTRLPGRLRLETGPEVVGALARTLALIHRFVPPERPRSYYHWAYPERRVVPPWAGSGDVWDRAFARIARDAPEVQSVFLHRDFHAGNVLFVGAEVTGVVDWVETSWGPPELDVAHCSAALALLGGDPEPFRDAYRAAGGALEESEREYWELVDAIGFLPDPVKVARPWRDAGAALSDGLVRERLERYVAGVLDRTV